LDVKGARFSLTKTKASKPVVAVVAVVAAPSTFVSLFVSLFFFLFLLKDRLELPPRPRGQARRLPHPPGPALVRSRRGVAPRRGADGSADLSSRGRRRRRRRRRGASVAVERRRKSSKHPRGDRVFEAVKVVVAGEEPPPWGPAVGPRGHAVVVGWGGGGSDERDGQKSGGGRCLRLRRRGRRTHFRVAASLCLLLLRSLLASSLALFR